ncbi:MAG: HEPN domain-containing protein [Candidatus Desantisbacteria bacterium]
MNTEQIRTDAIIKYWKDEAAESLKVAWHLYEKDDYSYSLFFGHLAVEKILKAFYVEKEKQHAPFTHDLLRLVEKINVPLSDDQKKALIKITAYNLEARYPELTGEFRKKCTKEYTKTELEQIEETYKWFRSMI